MAPWLGGVVRVVRSAMKSQAVWRWLRQASIIGAVALAAAGCGVVGRGPASTALPAGDNAKTIWDMFIWIFWISVLVFLVVAVVLTIALIRFRERPGETRLPRQIHGNTRLEIAWTLVPVVILAVIAVPTISNIFAFDRDPGPNAIKVKVIGHQWWWEFQYPDYNIVTADDLHIVVNRQVLLEMTSADVIHSFWPPELSGKRDAIPGKTNLWSFTPLKTGEYQGQCAQFCGDQHANMRFRVIVQTQEEFDAWVKQQQQPAADVSNNPLAVKGQQIFFTPSNGCIGCHMINGTQAQGKVGPNLTHFGSRDIIAGGILTNTPENLSKWLTDPQAVKPGAKMVLPRKLTPDEVQALVAYLESLK